MGMFTQRPEDPTEWAGLPSEPLEPRSAADRLADAPSISLLGESGTAVSIAIPMPAAVEDGDG
ncbi:hypothetical protein [Microbacterium sp.]|uniref:hypothetical protein n=1 Tax=Microbacterium sp. TaxID=51671 RepID=UPI003221B0B0